MWTYERANVMLALMAVRQAVVETLGWVARMFHTPSVPVPVPPKSGLLFRTDFGVLGCCRANEDTEVPVKSTGTSVPRLRGHLPNRRSTRNTPCRMLGAIAAMSLAMMLGSAASGQVVPTHDYRFDGPPGSAATIIADSGSSPQPGTAVGGPNFSSNVHGLLSCTGPAATGESLSLNSSQRVNFSGAFSFNAPGDMTLAFWLNSPFSQHGAILWGRSDDTDSNRFHVYVNSDATLGYDYRDPSGALHCLSGNCGPGGALAVPRNTWTHIMLTRQGGTYRCYINGSLARTSVDTGILPTSIGWGISSRSCCRFIGLIDDVRFYSGALSPAQVLPDPVISSQPASANCGTPTAMFSVSATGTGPFTYRWQVETAPAGSDVWNDLFDGPIPGSAATATNSNTASLTITNADATAATRYRCRVSNACGSVTSESATLSISPSLTVSLLSPAGSENLLAGFTTPITWSATGGSQNSVTLEYQLAGEPNWNLIATGLPNTGLYSLWMLPVVGEAIQARLRVSVTDSCTGMPVTATGFGSFFIVPALDEGDPCTADLFDSQRNQVLRSIRCDECSDTRPCINPCWECRNGRCSPPLDACVPLPCKFVYRICDECMVIDLCADGECCGVDGRCYVPGGGGGECPPNPDEIQRFLIDHFVNGIGLMVEDELIRLVPVLLPPPNLPLMAAVSYGMINLPTGGVSNATYFSFEWQLINPGEDEVFTVSFGNQLLFRTSTASPQGQWVRQLVYVGDFAGQRDALTFSLIRGSAPTSGDELLIRDFKLYGPGRVMCAADFNNDTFVNSQDFFDFLAAFFSLQPAADFNADGFINSQDFFDFLAAFFGGCS